jgi:hypothetical protein
MLSIFFAYESQEQRLERSNYAAMSIIFTLLFGSISSANTLLLLHIADLSYHYTVLKTPITSEFFTKKLIYQILKETTIYERPHRFLNKAAIANDVILNDRKAIS